MFRQGKMPALCVANGPAQANEKAQFTEVMSILSEFLTMDQQAWEF